MNTRELVQKLWNLCHILRDDGITYHQYVTELSYLLFIKMLKETERESCLPPSCRWLSLATRKGEEQYDYYRWMLQELANCEDKLIRRIYANAVTNIRQPVHLEKLVKSMDGLDWYSARLEGFGDLYEGLLDKNAGEKKSGAGQYFTPRPLVNVMVRLIDPRPGESCYDPAAGTFGFMVACDRHVRMKTNDYRELNRAARRFQQTHAFGGCELVAETHRLALMNAALHGLDSDIQCGDSLSGAAMKPNSMDVILTNPPFGTKKGGERSASLPLLYPTANKQLNFLQAIGWALKADGQARAAVVLSDNVLFLDGDGQKVRADLMEKCNLHTILRLPTGIFYAPGVKTNVLFFTRGKTDQRNTRQVWFYDLRSDMPAFGKRTPLTEQHFEGFVAAYTATDRTRIRDERLSCYTREEIAERGDSLDLGLLATKQPFGGKESKNPVEGMENAIEKLEQALGLLREVVEDIKKPPGP